MTNRLSKFAFILVSLHIASSPAAAEGFRTGAGVLSRPGHAILFRHAIAPGTGDPPGFRLDDCSTQRNLSEEGRRQARELGRRLREAGITEARVYSSRWCRSLETAELLGLGPVTPLPVLDSFFSMPGRESRQTRELRNFLYTLPPGPSVVMVTHQVNITGLTGIVPPSGGGVIVRFGKADGTDGSAGVRFLETWP